MDEILGNIVVRPYKCDADTECECCEHWLWCKGRNKDV